MWKVDMREVTMLGSEYNEEAYRIGNLTQFFRHRTMASFGGDCNRRAYTTIGELGAAAIFEKEIGEWKFCCWAFYSSEA